MALTPERIAELERLKAMMQPLATDAKRKAQAILNAEKGAGQPVKLPMDYKSKGGLEKFLKDSKVKDVLYRGGIGHKELAKEFLEGKSRPGYSTFASTSPHVAGSYAHTHEDNDETVGGIAPLHINVHTLHEFPVTTDRHGSRKFDKFAFDRHARTLEPGHALVARQVYDQGPRASVKTDPKRLYSYPSDIYAWNNGTETKSALSKAQGGTISQDAMRLAVMNKGGQPKHHYPYAQAHETARLNAIRLLGLHEHNTPEERAKAMGYTGEGFHATAADISEINPTHAGATDYGTIGQGFYIDPSKNAAYSNLVNRLLEVKRPGQPRRIMPVRYKPEGLFDATDLGAIRDLESSKRATKALQEAGHSGTFSRQHGSDEVNEVAMFNPAHVRSRFAAFDPAKKHETHLLAKHGGRVTHAHHLEIEERPL